MINYDVLNNKLYDGVTHPEHLRERSSSKPSRHIVGCLCLSDGVRDIRMYFSDFLVM